MKLGLILSLLAAGFALSGCSSLGRRLLSDDPAVRAEALRAAALAGTEDKETLVAGLRKKLSSARTDRRIYAASALEDIGPAAAGAAPELLAACFDTEPAVAESAERSLRKYGDTAAYLAGRLASPDPAERGKAAEVLSAQGDAGALALAANFERGSRELAIESLVTLAKMGPAAGKAVPALARAAVSSDPVIRPLAASALSDIGGPAGTWLAEMLRSPNPKYKLGASAVLAAMPSLPPEAVDNLAGAVWDEDAWVRQNAGKALAAGAPAALSVLREDRVSGLVTAAAGEDAVAPLAAAALIKSGKAPQRWLAGALRAKAAGTRRLAAEAMAGIPRPDLDHAPALMEALRDPDPAVRRHAAQAIGKYPAAAAAEFPAGTADALYDALKAADPATAELLVIPLSRRALSDKIALARLISALKLPDPGTRIAVIEALRGMGPGAAEAEDALWAAFRSGLCRQKAAAARALAAVNRRLAKRPAVARAMRQLCPEPPAAPGVR